MRTKTYRKRLNEKDNGLMITNHRLRKRRRRVKMIEIGRLRLSMEATVSSNC